MTIGGRRPRALLAVAAGAVRHRTAQQRGRTIKLIVPAAPGASTDFVARLSAEHISRAQGVTVVVENRAGANGMIGVEAVSRAAPDGNTLLVTANTYLLDALTAEGQLPSGHALRSGLLPGADRRRCWWSTARSPYRTLKDLLDAAKAKPGELSIAAVGPGSTFQLGFIALTRAAGVNMTYVPYHGSAPAVTAVLGQHVTSAFSGYAVVVRADQGRQAARARRRHVEADRAAAGCCRPSTSWASRASKSTTGSAWWRRRTTPKDKLAELSVLVQGGDQAPESKAKLARAISLHRSARAARISAP